MKIIIDENEIQEALNAYCATQVVIPEGKKIKVDFTVGRGANGTTATIDFEDIETSEKATEPAAEKTTKKAIAQVDEIVEEAAKEKATTPAEVKEDTKPVEEPVPEVKEEPVAETVGGAPSGDSLFGY